MSSQVHACECATIEADHELTMSESNNNQGARARPKYGELAPEGWNWKPPEDADRLDTAKPLEPVESALPAEAPSLWGAEQKLSPLEQAAGLKPVPVWNRPVTLMLLVLGLVGVLISIATLTELPVSMQLVYTNQGLGTYNPAPSVAAIALAGEITQAVIWVISAVISGILIARRRLSFYVPLVAGVVAAIVFIVFIMLVIATDPTLMNSYTKS